MISSQQIETVSSWLQANLNNPSIEQELRSAFPELHFTFCLDDDVMSDHAAVELQTHNLYLVDSSQHCLCLTNDPEQASGLVVAECCED